MAYDAFDPREDIRRAISTMWDYDDDGNNEYCLFVDNAVNDSIPIPMFLPGETRTGDMEYMPFIEMTLTSSPVGVHNVQGDVRDQRCYMDFHIWYSNTDNISATTFGKTVADELINKIMTYRQTTSSCTWVEIINDGREMIEPGGEGIVFHRVIECYATNYNYG